MTYNIFTNTIWHAIIFQHSMARANLNKSKKVLNSTTTASKYIPKRPRICFNWNSLFQTKIFFVKVPLNVNSVKQDLLNKKQFLKFLWSEEFQLIQTLRLFGIMVVEFETFLILFQIGSGHTATSSWDWKMNLQISVNVKVRTFWKGHKNLKQSST